MQSKQAYEQKMKAKMDQWQAEMDKIEAKAREADADARLAYARQIGDLKAKQQGPVRMLDELSKNLPDWVWLASVLEKKDSISINGFALNANKVADFVENLNRSGYFKVTDGPTYSMKRAKKGVQNSVSFKVTVKFSLPRPEGMEDIEEEEPKKGKKKKKKKKKKGKGKA